MRRPSSVAALNEFSRVRLSKSFFMRDFLFSEIAAVHGISNLPDDPELAIEAGSKLCQHLLEPLQDAFGRIAIRSAFRSSRLNAFGSRQGREGRAGYNCASNTSNFGSHIWDIRGERGLGATACVIVPSVWDAFQGPGDWRKLAWWIHDHLDYCALEFYPRNFAFNISWSEKPRRQISSYVSPRGILTKRGMDNNGVGHFDDWHSLQALIRPPLQSGATVASDVGLAVL